jgi:trans-2,3-dihydro-3-hydroxyanthranilate isomerase
MSPLNSTHDLFHVDVFASGPLSGNGLTVFLNTDGWTADVMQRLTEEMRQFESIFLSSISDSGATARVFTVEEELPFAGHPVLGAAAVLHRTRRPTDTVCNWTMTLPIGNVNVRTESRHHSFLCQMDQGVPQFLRTVEGTALEPVLSRLGLTQSHLWNALTPQVVSTGLPYLILPVNAAGLAKAAIATADLEEILQSLSAKFVLVLDVESKEVRTWDNLGKVEDIATGSAAGPAAAYLIRNGICTSETDIELSQGRFIKRPSKLRVHQTADCRLLVSGEVWPVNHGRLEYPGKPAQ